MQVHIFTEGSNTTGENPDQQAKEYYEGLYKVVAGLDEELADFADTHLHVLTVEYGIARGDERMSSVYAGNQTPVGSDDLSEHVRTELLDATADADVMVILLSTENFQETVEKVFDALVETAKPESIWCLGAAQSSLEEHDFEELGAKDWTVPTYQRVGVARIGTDTREELLDAVKHKATQ